MNRMRAVLSLAVALAATSVPAQELVNPSKAERAEIARFMRSKLNDPYSVREARIGQFRPSQKAGDVVKLICMRFNAKNQFGGYSGEEDMIFYYDANGPSWTSPDKYEICPKFSVYKSFPELNGKGK